MAKKGFKYFIGQKIDFYANSSQKMSAYEKEFDKNKCICFLIKDEKLLEKFNKIWNKVNNIIWKEFDSKHLYNKKYLKT